MGEEEHVLFSIVGDELRVERLRSQLVSSARYRVSQTSLKELAARCRPDAVVWHAGDRQAAEAGRRLCEAAVVSMSGQASASSGGPVGVEVGDLPLCVRGRPSLSAIVQALGAQARAATAVQQRAPSAPEAATAEPEPLATAPRPAEPDVGDSLAREVADRLSSLLEARARRQRGKS